MAGISSNALMGTNYSKNRKEFNGIEHITDLDLNQYDAFYRNFDPQLGKWRQIDPKPNDAVSLYAAMDNNPIRYSDFLGGITRRKLLLL
jgi:RHS repeat-associated protein